jgi:chromosomal replication initiator protein
MEDSQIAAELSASLAEKIGAERFELWFGSQAQLCIEEGCLYVRAASAFVRDWVQGNLGAEIRTCWEAIVGGTRSVTFAVDANAGRTEGTQAAVNGSAGSGDGPVHAIGAHVPTSIDVKAGAPTAARCELTLEGFVVGASNEYAFRAADLTGRGRQQASPILFCGPTGVGKTHLLRAIVREYRRHHPRAAAVYLTAEQFTTGFIEALRGSGLPSFRQKCRGARLLVIDDIQFFAGKQRTIEELLHTFDTLAADGKQLVLASDRGLAELRPLGPELVSRLSGGLVCELESPEFITRREILRRLAREMEVTLDDKILSLVATQISGGARELRGAVHRLQTMSLAYDKPVTQEMAEQALADMVRQSTRAVRLVDVQKAVCDVFGVEASQLKSDRKGRSLSEPRMLAMWLARRYTRAPWSEIGEFFGRKSHSTVISAHKRVERLISSEGQIAMNDQACRVEDAIRKLEMKLRTA